MSAENSLGQLIFVLHIGILLRNTAILSFHSFQFLLEKSKRTKTQCYDVGHRQKIVPNKNEFGTVLCKLVVSLQMQNRKTTDKISIVLITLLLL